MARKKSSWNIGNIDDLMDSAFDQIKAEAGSNSVYIGSEADVRIVGLPLPALCLRYAFMRNVLPLSRTMVVFGRQGSCKSSFLYEVFRWHRFYGGRSGLAEAESKESPDLCLSINGYDEKAVITNICQGMDGEQGWMKAAREFIRVFQSKMEGTAAKPGPGRVVPCCVGIDSLSGKVSEETSKKIDKAGFSSRSWSVEANLISPYLKSTSDKLLDWPLTLACVNHLKDGPIGPNGRPSKNLPGGTLSRFMATYEIEMTFLGDDRMNASGVSGIHVQFNMAKNSLGESRRRFNVHRWWWNAVGSDGVSRQWTIWDWDAASINLLLDFCIGNKFSYYRKQIGDVIDLHPVTSGGKKVWSDAIGISKDNPVSYRQAGMELERHQDILDKLHAILGIKINQPFQPAMDFREQLAMVAPEKISPQTVFPGDKTDDEEDGIPSELSYEED